MHHFLCGKQNTYINISKHQYNLYVLFPYHLPELPSGALQGTLSYDVLVRIFTRFKLEEKKAELQVN